MNHATAGDDANGAASVCLPRDVLANIFVRLPATDLRRFRRVCKEWHEIISDPVFVNEHMDHGPWALTHTIVFLGGRRSKGADGAIIDEPPRNGQGFLFDEQWRLAATFTAGESEAMVGTCKGLLCFLDVRQGAINVVEPFTGSSLVLPLPPTNERICDPAAYSFGFDPGSRRYKIFHLGLDVLSDETWEQDLYVYTMGAIGGGESWMSARVAGAADAEPLVSHSNPLFGDGSLYWSVDKYQLGKVARFDLATGEIMLSEPVIDHLRLDNKGKSFHVMTDSDTRMCMITVGPFGACDMFFMGEAEDSRQNSCSGLTLPAGRYLASPQALQRGHLLLEDRDAGIYIHPISPARNDIGTGKLLLKIGKDEDKEPAKSGGMRGLFVPALLNQVQDMPGPDPHEWSTRRVATFCYATPLSHVPLAHRCGFATTS